MKSNYKLKREKRQVSSNDFEELERIMKRGATEKQNFERLEISKEDLLRLFGVNDTQLSPKIAN
jgi:threonyl-tRNA synthetase